MEQCAWTALTISAAIIAILKGFHLPNLWSATQLQVDYAFGFVKRGAAGSVLRLLDLPIERYWVFASISFIALAAALFIFVIFLRQRPAQKEVALYSTIFLSSFATTYFVHLVGYLDVILLTLTLIVLAIPQNGLWIAATYIVCIACTLIHESFLLSFFPLVWFRVVMGAMLDKGRGKNFAVLHGIALPLFVAIVTVLVAFHHPLTAEQVSMLQAMIGASVNFPIRPEFFVVMTNSASDNMRLMLRHFQMPSWWINEAGAFASLLWVALFFTWQSLRLVKESTSPKKTTLKIAVVYASLSPTLLQAFGWDIFRWYAIAACTAFVVYRLLAERLAISLPAGLSFAQMRILALVLVGLNLATGAGLFDGIRINTFPFTDELLDLYMTVKTQGYLPIPNR